MVYDINGSRVLPHMWTQTHADCLTPWQPCDAEYVYAQGSPTLIKYYCGKVKVMSYVNSSRYETETPVQQAQRLLRDAQEALAKAEADEAKKAKNTRFGTVAPPSGSVIKFRKTYDPGGKQYQFAALNYQGSWFLTQSNGFTNSPMTWDELTDFIGDGRAWLMTLRSEYQTEYNGGW